MRLFRKPYDGSIEAEYLDGYIHSEAKLADISPYDKTYNVLSDILQKRPEAKHGKLVRFSCFHDYKWHHINFNNLPDNARPIRYKKMEMDLNGPRSGVSRLVTVGFGYQYTDNNGRNVQEVTEL